MKYFIADQHFFHRNMIVKMDKRGFSDMEEMHEHMISQWNKKVREKDEVYILGDLSFGNGKQTNDVLRRLNGRKYLIEGNHDRHFLRDKEFDRSLLVWVKPYYEVKENKKKIILSHYPIVCYNGQYRKDEDGNPVTYMLYGHVHATHDYDMVMRFQEEMRESLSVPAHRSKPEHVPSNMANCFCMFSDYQPLTLEEWVEKEREREEEKKGRSEMPML